MVLSFWHIDIVVVRATTMELAEVVLEFNKLITFDFENGKNSCLSSSFTTVMKQ